MLVNSFDTKYSKMAKKYENLDRSFTKIVGSNNKFSRIFTSVIENKSLKSHSGAKLRSDITGQVINIDSGQRLGWITPDIVNIKE